MKVDIEKIARAVFQREDGDYQVKYWDGEVKIIPGKGVWEYPILVGTNPLVWDIAAKDARIAELETQAVVIRGALETLLRWGLGRRQRKLVNNALSLDATLGSEGDRTC